MPAQQMGQPTVVVVNNNTGPPPVEPSCCCCIPMSVGIWIVLAFVLLNLYGAFAGTGWAEGIVTLFSYMPFDVLMGYYWTIMIMTILPYVMQAGFVICLIIGVMRGDHTSGGRYMYKTSFVFLILSYLILMLFFLLFGLINFGIVGFILLIPLTIQFSIDTCLVAAWRSSYSRWWVLKVYEENGNQWPAGMKK